MYSGHDLGQTCPIIFPVVDVSMAVVADWDLLAIDSRQIETESLDFFAALADMPHMVHFHPLWASGIVPQFP
jgi:hypothetical protein